MIKPLQPGFRPWENHTTALAHIKVDGPLGRRFLRGLSLTAAMPLRVVVGRL